LGRTGKEKCRREKKEEGVDVRRAGKKFYSFVKET